MKLGGIDGWVIVKGQRMEPGTAESDAGTTGAIEVQARRDRSTQWYTEYTQDTGRSIDPGHSLYTVYRRSTQTGAADALMDRGRSAEYEQPG